MALADYRSVSSFMGCPNDKGIWGDIYIEDIELKSVPVQNKIKEVTPDLLKVSFCTSYL